MFSQDSNRKFCPKKNDPNDPNLPFKEKEKEGGEGRPNLVAYGRFQCLVALEKVQRLVALERVQCLVANGRFQCLVVFERRRRSIFFTSSHFPPKLLKPFFFPLILGFTLPWFETITLHLSFFFLDL